MRPEEKEQLFDRILKLHRKAVSAKEIGSEAEAATFAEHVQRLLIKHDLEMSEVEFEAERVKDPIKFHFTKGRGKKRRILWTEVLAKGCAEAHFCTCIALNGSDSIMIIGRGQHRAVADFMIHTLIRLGEQLADKAYTKFFYECQALGDVKAARGYRNGFLAGYAVRISQRYKDLMTEAFHEHTGTGLVRLSKETQLVEQATENIKAAFSAEQSDPMKIGKVASAGVKDGMAAGDAVPLKANAVSGKTGEGQKQLGAGQKLLP